MTRRRTHRWVFAVAGCYNLAWGGWVALRPEWLYRVMGIAEPTHPEIAACLGMVIGLYGIVYLEVARVPERGGVLAAVGLTGKILGPVGLAANIVAGHWPAAGLSVVVFNDLIWWLPFAWYLHDVWPHLYADLRRLSPRPATGSNPGHAEGILRCRHDE